MPATIVHYGSANVRSACIKATSRDRECIQTIFSLSLSYATSRRENSDEWGPRRTLVSSYSYSRTHTYTYLYICYVNTYIRMWIQNSLLSRLLSVARLLSSFSFYLSISFKRSFSVLFYVIVPNGRTGSSSCSSARPMRARRSTPIQSYIGLGQVRRERQRVVSWSLVPRSGYGILTPSSGVWQAMAGPIDVSATSHPRQSAPLFTTRPPPTPLPQHRTPYAGFPHPNRQIPPSLTQPPPPDVPSSDTSN